MYGDVGTIFEQRNFELLDKEAFATNLRQRRTQQLIATRGHREQFDN
jgi:hypothetical protein